MCPIVLLSGVLGIGDIVVTPAEIATRSSAVAEGPCDVLPYFLE